MGGMGSGRKFGKPCTGDKLALDVRWMHRTGRLQPGSSGGLNWTRGGAPAGNIGYRAGFDRVTLEYTLTRHGQTEKLNYPVQVTWTACNFGGRRPWWICPAAGCGRRVAVLFVGRLFLCRHCQGLAYDCQQESDDDRATRQAEKLRKRLGWEPGILNLEGGKPKGMHWRTFDRLKQAHDLHADKAMQGIADGLAVLNKRLASFKWSKGHG